MREDSPVNAEKVIESHNDCDKLRSSMCGRCAEYELIEKSIGSGLETKTICKNCGSETGTYEA